MRKWSGERDEEAMTRRLPNEVVKRLNQFILCIMRTRTGITSNPSSRLSNSSCSRRRSLILIPAVCIGLLLRQMNVKYDCNSIPAVLFSGKSKQRPLLLLPVARSTY